MLRKRKQNTEQKSARLNLMINAKLKEWTHKYARQHSTSISSIITEYLSYLRDRERGDGVRQI